ncbi:MAG: EscU/YscU/HrcU family type III secretion system export apparatus switch protein [Candidatus Hydrogenedens sp.]
MISDEPNDKEKSELQIKKAVALKYEMHKDNAPRVIAKGERIIAEKIIAIGREKGIFIHEDPELVALLSKIDVGAEIPEILYRAVAEVLSFVFRLNQKMGGQI